MIFLFAQITLDYLARGLGMHGALEDAPKAEASSASAPAAVPPSETAPLRKRDGKRDRKQAAAVAKYAELHHQSARYQDQRGEQQSHSRFHDQRQHNNTHDLLSLAAAAGSGTAALTSAIIDQSPLRTPNLEGDVKEIRRVLRGYVTKLNDRDGQGRVSKEWRMVARVLDRIFFIFYLSCIIVSFVAIFTQLTAAPSPSRADGTCTEEIRNNSKIA